MRFFAALRRLFAADYIEQAFIAVGTDAVREKILPRLKKTLAAEDDPKKQDEIRSLISEYEPYANPSTPEARKWGEVGASVVHAQARRFNLGVDAAADAGQQLAMYFYEKPNWKKVWDKFDLERGPEKLLRFFGHVLRKNAIWFFREFTKRPTVPLQTKEEDRMDIIERTPAPEVRKEEEYELEERAFEDAMMGLRKHIHRKFPKGWMKDMFDTFMKTALRKGKVNMAKDVYPKITKKYDKQKSTMNSTWTDMRRIMLRYFQDELGVAVTKELKKKFKLSSEDVVVYEQIRRRIAAWVLPYVLRFHRMA